MKKAHTPEEALEKIFERMEEQYNTNLVKNEQKINFTIINGDQTLAYTFKLFPESMSVQKGGSSDSSLSIRIDINDWFALAGGRLNPIVAVLTRKLKFKGNINLFKNLLKETTVNVEHLQISEKESPQIIPKKVLAVNASPRGKNSYTHLLLNRFIEDMSGVKVEEVVLSSLKIKHCTGCGHCLFKTGGECIIKDDMQNLYKLQNECDLHVYSMPLYADDMPGILKNYFDRSVSLLHPYIITHKGTTRHPSRLSKQKKMLVIANSGFPEMESFATLKSHFEALSKNIQIPVEGYLFLSAGAYYLNNPTLYPITARKLDALSAAGRQITTNGAISKSVIKTFNAPMPKKWYRKFTEEFNLHCQTKIDAGDTDY